MSRSRTERLADARRIVVKIGSNVLTRDSGLNLEAIDTLSRQICDLIDGGRQVILVSSGAMAAGLRKLGLKTRPTEVPKRQAIAAVGQAGLIQAYETAFGNCGRRVAQILLTSEDLNGRQRYLNGRNTLNTLLAWDVVPVINENDTVMIDEITVGDNDNLSAMVTMLMDADVLVNLTDIDGLYDCDPRVHTEAQLVPVVDHIDAALERMAGEIPGALGRGGMRSKISAAKKVTAAGIPMIIANGLMPDVLARLFTDSTAGTYFSPQSNRLANRKSWIGYTLTPVGRVVLDDGAVRAVVNEGKSLLPIGVRAVDGDFSVGAPVAIAAGDGQILGTGLANYSAADIQRIMGLRTDKIEAVLGYKPYDEVIHRDNLTVTAGPAANQAT